MQVVDSHFIFFLVLEISSSLVWKLNATSINIKKYVILKHIWKREQKHMWKPTSVFNLESAVRKFYCISRDFLME